MLRKKAFFHKSNSVPDVKIMDNLIGLTLNNAGEITLELNLNQLLCHPDARNAMLVPVSYCEPILRVFGIQLFTLVCF